MDSDFTAHGENPGSAIEYELQRRNANEDELDSLDNPSVEFSNLESLDLSFDAVIKRVELEDDTVIDLEIKVLDDGGKEKGVIRGRIEDSNEFYIQDTHVNEEDRGQGLGKDLFKRLLVELQENDIFSEVEKVSGNVRHPAQYSIREYFFGEDLVFKDYDSGEKLDRQEIVGDNGEVELNEALIEGDLDDLVDGWEEIE
ncbi:MAG: GNAT family N-acetyltransferase [Candidatus Magasanikbacteria bacterium]